MMRSFGVDREKNGLIKQFLKDTDWGPLDFLVVDAPPGTSDEHLSIVQYLKHAGIDGALVITTPQEVAMADVRKELSFCAKVGIPVLGVVENMSSLSIALGSAQLRFTSGTEGLNITEQIREVIETHLRSTGQETSLNVQIDVFAATRGGAEKMCLDARVPFLGRVPLDPGIAAAAENGRSLFSDADGVEFQTSTSFSAIRSVIDGVLSALGEK